VVKNLVCYNVGVTGNEIRQKFVQYFEKQGHRHVRSSSLVPVNDPTLLFTNAGMNQFKDVFLGLEQRDYARAVTSQKCVRAGGKHNDLENVGFTNRHLTFFEMLGNFSFGDYFKKEAIAFAWELITSPAWYGISKDKLYATVFKGEEGIPRDEDAEQFWRATGVPAERIFAMGMKDNFWAMGDTGPCGPCSELHYDMGPAASDQAHADCRFPCDCGRFVEIWNLVFMQFNRDAGGTLTPLPKPCVDTGMGLDRLTAVLQGKISVFESDLFMPLVRSAAKMAGIPLEEELEREAHARSAASLRVIADHARATAFLVADGVRPSNEGRGYVLRKIMRRAINHGRKLGLEKTFLHAVTTEVAGMMGAAYPELLDSAERVSAVVLAEENRFARTLGLGLKKFDELVAPAVQERSAGASLAGDKAFMLYDTYGLPRDFIEDALRDAGLTLDAAGFERALAEQRERARASWKGAAKETARPVYAKLAEVLRTEPEFYRHTLARDCRIEAIVTRQGQVQEAPAGTECEIVLDRTAFYAESGGQQADTGSLFDHGQSQELAVVKGAYYPVSGLVAHRIVAKETLRAGDFVMCVADPERRARNMRNHTATHLLHAALRNTLGTHVKQSGSLVAPDRLRFDFSHFAGVDPAALREIEQQVNEQILKNAEIETMVTTLDEALASGALAFFGDKYPEKNVRVVTIPDPAAMRGFYSKELCGGTHVRRSGEIGVLKITVEQSVAAGMRRVEAITGDAALADYQRAIAALGEISSALNVGHEGLAAAVERMAQQAKQLEKQIAELKNKGAQGQVDALLRGARTVKDVRVISARLDGADRNTMRQVVDTLRQKLGSGVVVLGAAEDSKVALISAVTRDLQAKLHAGKIVQEIARQVGGSGGGRADLAEAGGKDVAALETALENVFSVVERML
jgi:alanyl-tRNA synthetase